MASAKKNYYLRYFRETDHRICGHSFTNIVGALAQPSKVIDSANKPVLVIHEQKQK
jgi:hypothetical protein